MKITAIISLTQSEFYIPFVRKVSANKLRTKTSKTINATFTFKGLKMNA
jgi:hypothetical protein